MSAANPPITTIAIVGVTVVPMDRERVIPNQVVIVRGDRVVAVGSGAEVAVPHDALRIDGTGQYVVPGLVDAHVHLSTNLRWAPARTDFGDGPLYLANGVTTVINLGGSPEQLDWRRRVAAGELIGPTIYTSGEFINEPRMSTPQQTEQAVRAQKAEGYDLVKFRERPNTTVGLLLAAYTRMIEVAKEVDLPLIGHAPINLGLGALLAAGQPLAHMNMLSNIYFMPLASHSRTLMATAAGLVSLLVASIGLALATWRQKRRVRSPGDTQVAKAARLSGALAAGGFFAAVALVSLLPGGPGSESQLLRWALTVSGAALIVCLVLLGTAIANAWANATLSVRVRFALAASASTLLALLLTTFWIPISWRSSDDGIAHVTARLREAGISVQSTLVVYDSLGGPTRRDMLDDPAIAYLLPRTHELWAALPKGGPPGYNLPAFTRRLTGALHRAEVPIVAGTDAMEMELIVPGFSFHRELRLLREAGLTPYEVIFAATRAPATFLGRSNEFGTIAVGQRADLLLVSGNPLENLAHLSTPSGVMARGRWFSRERLRDILDALRGQS